MTTQANNQTQTQTNENSLALLKKGTVDVVAEKIRQFQESKEIHLPADYSAENALKSAWLILQDTKDKNNNPALTVCTKDSIANSLLDMVVQGLNPAKKQCYFIVYGNKLTCQRSYFGTMAVTKMVAKAKDIYAQVIYKGDDFEYTIERGRKKITKHVQRIENVSNENILAAYCVIEFDDGRPEYVEIMTIDQIKKAWQQGVLYNEKGNGTHQKFTEEMAKKTVINRACKAYINSSNDNYLLLHHFNRTEDARIEEEIEEEIAVNANTETIDITASVKPDGEATKQDSESIEKPVETGGPNF